MEIHATLPPNGRDLRLDFFRGVANWAIFLDHIPHNLVNWITVRNYGFSDAADLFVFISGYTAAFVYARMMLDRGFIVGAAKLFKRVWQLYVAHIVLFVIYIVAVGLVAQKYNDPELLNEFNVAGLIESPLQVLTHGLLLSFKPLNLDVLPLYVVLMGLFPPILWMMLRKPDLVMIASLVLYFAARHYQWNLPAYPYGTWYFNPYTWQLLFIFGAWFSLGGARESRWLIRSRALPVLAIVYLLFSLVMTLAASFSSIADLLPDWLNDMFIPNDKTNLAPYRVIHFVIIAFLVTRFMPRNWPGLEWKIFDPVIKCGQQSLPVFCIGIFLSFVAHFLLILSWGSIWAQITVSAAGIAVLCAVAYYADWYKGLEKKRKAAPATQSQPASAPVASPAE